MKRKASPFPGIGKGADAENAAMWDKALSAGAASPASTASPARTPLRAGRQFVGIGQGLRNPAADAVWDAALKANHA